MSVACSRLHTGSCSRGSTSAASLQYRFTMSLQMHARSTTAAVAPCPDTCSAGLTWSVWPLGRRQRELMRLCVQGKLCAQVHWHYADRAEVFRLWQCTLCHTYPHCNTRSATYARMATRTLPHICARQCTLPRIEVCRCAGLARSMHCMDAEDLHSADGCESTGRLGLSTSVGWLVEHAMEMLCGVNRVFLVAFKIHCLCKLLLTQEH